MTHGRRRDRRRLGWLYVQVTVDEGGNTVLTIDNEFKRVDAFETELVLSAADSGN